MDNPRVAGVAVLATLAFYACGGDGNGIDIFNGGDRTPTSIAAAAGNNQNGVVGQALAERLRVVVRDVQNRGVPNEPVSFIVTSGAGSISADVVGGPGGDNQGFQASVAVDVNTDANGEASVVWTLGTGAGTQTATARVRSLTPVQFTASAEPGPAASMTMVAGDGQAGLIGLPLDDPFVVNVVDGFGNAVGGAPVVWDIVAGNGEFFEVSTATDEGGFSYATVVPGPVAEPVDVVASLFELPTVAFFALGFVGLADPTGDLLTSASEDPVPPDVTSLIAWRQAGELVYAMTFAGAVDPIDVGGPNVVVGFVDFDTDQDSGTGVRAIADDWRTAEFPGSTGMGTDYYITMYTTGGYELWDVASNEAVVKITPEFDVDLVVLVIPLELLADDGVLNICTGVATQVEPTDIAPNDGNLSTALPPPLAGAAQREELRRLTRRAQALVEERGLLSAGRATTQVRSSPPQAGEVWKRR